MPKASGLVVSLLRNSGRIVVAEMKLAPNMNSVPSSRLTAKFQL